MWPSPEQILMQMLLDFGVEGTVQSIESEPCNKFIELGMVGSLCLWDIRLPEGNCILGVPTPNRKAWKHGPRG